MSHAEDALVVRRFLAYVIVPLLALVLSVSGSAANATLTVIVDGVDRDKGVVGMLVFDSPRGWPEDVNAAIRATSVPAHAGRVEIRVQLPPGQYAVVVLHDVNMNKKLDRTWYGKPREQWGMSNNPHAHLSAPSFDAARFRLKGDLEIRIVMQ